MENGTFGNFVNFLPLDKGIPIENAGGASGDIREWREMPDNTYASDAVMNNWQGLRDVKITLHEAGSRIVIAPDSTTSATAHGGRLYHEFTVECKDILNAPILFSINYGKKPNVHFMLRWATAIWIVRIGNVPNGPETP